MYVCLKQPRGDGERYVVPARVAAKETNFHEVFRLVLKPVSSSIVILFWQLNVSNRLTVTEPL